MLFLGFVCLYSVKIMNDHIKDISTCLIEDITYQIKSNPSPDEENCFSEGTVSHLIRKQDE